MPPLPSGLTTIAIEHLVERNAFFDLTLRVEADVLRHTLAALGLECWPVLEQIERDLGGLRFAVESESWLLGPYAASFAWPGATTLTREGSTLVCVGSNDTGRLFADREGIIWDEDAAAGTMEPRSVTLRGRLEKEAFGGRITVLEQFVHVVLPGSTEAERGARLLGLPRLDAPSDRFETWWQNDRVTLLRTPHDVRLFARDQGACEQALVRLTSGGRGST